MRFGSFIIACSFALALLLLADRRPVVRSQEHYSQVVDLTRPAQVKAGSERNSGTRIISPAALIPGTWGTAQIPAERLIAPFTGRAGFESIHVDPVAGIRALEISRSTSV